MAKFLFIQPSTEGYGRHSIPIVLISSILKSNGHQVKLLDTNFLDIGNFFGDRDHSHKISQLNFFKPVKALDIDLSKEKVNIIDRLNNIITSFSPDCICFSFWGSQRHAAGEFQAYSKGLKLISATDVKDIPIIVGGLIPTGDTENILKNTAITGVIRGESEYVYLDIAKRIDKKTNLSGISNLWLKKENGSIEKNNLRPLNHNLDEIPHADYDIYDQKSFYRPFNGKLYRFIDHELSRGCPNACSFCLAPFQKGTYDDPKTFRREKSIEKIISEMSYLKRRYNLEMIRFNDESFLDMNENKLEQLTPKYKQEVDLPFVIEATVKSLTKRKIELLKDMGCASISLGIESGNIFIRNDIYNKPRFTNEEAITRLKWVKQAGIQFTLFNIIGAPFETEKMILETIYLNKKIRPTYSVASIFQPWEGTKLSDFMEEKSNNITSTNHELTKIRDRKVSEDLIIHYYKYFVYYVYLPTFLSKLLAFLPIRKSLLTFFDALLRIRLKFI